MATFGAKPSRRTFVLMTLDEQLFYFIHNDLANPFLDAILPYWREKTTWIPAYLLAAFLLVKKYQWQGVRLLLLIGLGILIADQLTSSVIKPLVGRPRPCYAAAFAGQIRELVGCGWHESFPSSHSSNHFALAMILSLTWLKKNKGWQWALFLWAASISLAQVYVAKHYPVDILVGALIGLMVGWVIVLLYHRWRIDQW